MSLLFFFSNCLSVQHQWALWINVNALFTWWSGSQKQVVQLLCIVYSWFKNDLWGCFVRLWWIFFLGFMFILVHLNPSFAVSQWLYLPFLFLTFHLWHNYSLLTFVTVHWAPLQSGYHVVMFSAVWIKDYFITNGEPWNWAQCLSGGTVLFSWCICSGVLLPSTWKLRRLLSLWRVGGTWLAVATISGPSMRICSLAWDLAPERAGWQQDRSNLALLPLFSGDRELFSWKGIERLQYSTYDGQLALQFHNHTDGKWWVRRFPVGPCRH